MMNNTIDIYSTPEYKKVEAVVQLMVDGRLTSYRVATETNISKMSLATLTKGTSKIKNITYQLISAAILAVLWDLFTGWRGWSIDFVLPIAAACALVLLMVLTPALKIAAADAVLYVGAFIVLSWVAMILWLTGCLHVVFPTLICFGIGLISLAVLLIFAGKPIMAEIRRRFHV